VLIMSALARSLAIVTAMGLLGAAAAAPEPAWPPLETPSGAHVTTVAGDLVLNGKPCRVFRFDVPGRVDDVLQFYRTQFQPTRAVETRVKDQPVIATRRGDHFHTVQLQAVGDSVQATVITTALHAAPLQSAAARDTEALMPADTVVVSTMQSADGGQRSLIVIGVNQHSIVSNRDHLVAALRQRGFELVQDGTGSDAADASSLAMASPAESAVLTVADAGPYRTVVVQRTREARR